jgi:hypothetical protein
MKTELTEEQGRALEMLGARLTNREENRWTELRMLTDELIDPLTVLIADLQFAAQKHERQPGSPEVSTVLHEADGLVARVCELTRAIRRQVVLNDPSLAH